MKNLREAVLNRNTNILLHKIFYSAQTRDQIEPGYIALDNVKNERPDWFEYWPVRNFLINEVLDEDAYYGFFSPKFTDKTLLEYQQVIDFIRSKSNEFDVFLFSPQPDMGAFFLNIFEQGETFDSGLIESYEKFLFSIGRPVSLRQLVMDSRQIVFSNYFVAKPAFWREWLALNEALFTVCEGPETPLQQALTQTTSYPGAAQRKVFLMERAASLLLTIQPQWRTLSANPFAMGWSTARFREHPVDAFISDALKIAWREQGFQEYLQAFSQVRNRFVSSGKG
jgi:hypothetical protein